MMDVDLNRRGLERRLEEHGLRQTPQRALVYDTLLAKRDHPTAEEVYSRVKAVSPSISLATVYNCLEALVQCQLVRQVNHEREPTRYCPNLAPHAHFHDQRSGRVYDIDLPSDLIERVKAVLPPGYEVAAVDIAFHGRTVDESRSDLSSPTSAP